VPADHLLRSIDRFVDLSGIRQHLASYYSPIGRPSIDPELLIRMLIVGYCFGSPVGRPMSRVRRMAALASTSPFGSYAGSSDPEQKRYPAGTSTSTNVRLTRQKALLFQ